MCRYAVPVCFMLAAAWVAVIFVLVGSAKR